MDDVFDREAFLGGNENQRSTPMKTKKSLSKNDVWKTNHVPFGIVPFKGHVNFRRELSSLITVRFLGFHKKHPF